MIRGDKHVIYGLASDMESYPQFMDGVDRVTVLERGDHQQITQWEARLQGKPFRWIERDVFDDAKPGITYQQTSGDLKKFEGEWRFEDVPEGCKVTLTVDFEIGIPMFAAMLNPVAKLVVKQNCESMLAGLKARVEGAAG